MLRFQRMCTFSVNYSTYMRAKNTNFAPNITNRATYAIDFKTLILTKKFTSYLL